MNWLVRLLTFALFLVLAGTVGAAFVLERASRYPVEANFLTPWLERNASEQIEGGTVSIEKTRIALEPGEGGARLLLTGVRASGGGAAKPLDIGEMTVALSLPDMLIGRARLTRITIDDLSFGARRTRDGQFAFSIAPRSNQRDIMALSGIPGLGSVAEASTDDSGQGAETGLTAPVTTNARTTGDASPDPLNQLRQLLRARDGMFSRFETLKLTGGSVIFDDAATDERIVIHDATMTLSAEQNFAKAEVDGLFEIGSSFSSGQVALTTPLTGIGVDVVTRLQDVTLADFTAYLPETLRAEQRSEPVDLTFSGSFTEQGDLQRFALERYPLSALQQGQPTLAAVGQRRTGGAGGWAVEVRAPSETFANEPTLREALKDIFDFDGAITGAVQFDVAEDGRLLELNFDTAIGPGMVSIPSLYQQPIDLRGGRFVGQYTPAGLRFDTFEIAPIINGRDLGATQLALSVDQSKPGVDRVRLRVENNWRLSAADILALWPNRNEDEGRRWFRENIAQGLTSSQRLDLDIETGGAETIVHNLSADIAFSDGVFKLTDGLGYARNAQGRVRIDNALYLIDLDGSSLGPLNGSNNAIRIDLRDPASPRLAVKGQFDGAIRDSIAFLAAADIGLEDLNTTLPVDQLGGSLTAQADMAFSLTQPQAFKPTYDIRLNLQDLSVADYLGGLPVTAQSMPLRITPERIAASGPLRLGALAADAELDIRLDANRVENMTLKAVFSGDTADSGTLLGFLPDYVKGEVSGDLTFVQDFSGRRTMDIEANLGRAIIDLAPLPYFKPVGQPTMATARLTFGEQGLATIDTFKVDGPALHLLGTVEMADDGTELSRAALRNLIIGDNNLGALTVLNEREFMQIRIEDGQLDGRPIIESILENQGKQNASIVPGDKGAAASSGNQKPWLINIAGIRRFVVPGGKAFTDISLSATIDNGAVIQFVLDAKSPANLPGRPPELGTLQASLTPQANGFYRLSFQSDDAGSLFSTLNLTNEIRGGVIRVSADSALPLPKGGWLGSMEMLNFSVVDAPIMVQLLSLASLTGILELAAVGGLQFTHLTSNFTYGNSALYLDDLRMAGPSVGLTTEGSIDFEAKRFALQGNVTPFNLVSEIAGSIPVLGQVLTGTDGGGLFSAGYKVDGPFSSPAVNVNPFQILTPGIYRQWFQDIIGNN
ncbi:MAG: hypothetical protein CBC49_001840 [Alphaproteobacteria bacterium TMED89]|nr:hypothetical protein [Rhodospirillaceae bacterium]RPH19117.1 MAG: hypothetical protein CBC49_001840 [Alphaproteobacteria bacterium TMED89]